MSFETNCTINPICPYCGHEHHDAWEWHSGFTEGGTRECDACEKVFYAARDVSVSWHTHRVAESDGEALK